MGRREEHEEGGASASSFERSSTTAHAKRVRSKERPVIPLLAPTAYD